jgi:hypothetical protein
LTRCSPSAPSAARLPFTVHDSSKDSSTLLLASRFPHALTAGTRFPHVVCVRSHHQRHRSVANRMELELQLIRGLRASGTAVFISRKIGRTRRAVRAEELISSWQRESRWTGRAREGQLATSVPLAGQGSNVDGKTNEPFTREKGETMRRTARVEPGKRMLHFSVPRRCSMQGEREERRRRSGEEEGEKRRKLKEEKESF